MPSVLRIQKLNILLKEELSKIIDREIEFPKDCLVTLTRVDTSPDAHYAAVFVSVLGKRQNSVLEILRKNTYNIQQILNRRVRMRPVPRIRFAIDEEEVRRESVEKSLSDLKKKGEI